jgi:hypothetical protein
MPAPSTYRALALALMLAALPGLAACKLPVDPEGTTEAVRGGTLAVGLLGEEMPPDDARAVRRVAEALAADAVVVRGGAHELLAQLERGDVHLLAGGIPEESPFVRKAGRSNPIGHVTLGPDRVPRVLLVRQGENRFLLEVNRALQPLTREARR